jgi:transposase
MDNNSIHKTADVIAWLTQNHVNFAFLAPYSPEYSAIETVFALHKRHYRKKVAQMRARDLVVPNRRLAEDSWDLIPDNVVKKVCLKLLKKYRDE